MKVEVAALFASDGTSLSKEFNLEDEELKVSSYPHVRSFTSATHSIRTVEDLGSWIQAVADRGGCLLKGTLRRALENESRAGSTVANDETSWILLDIDKLDGYETVEEFLQLLPTPFRSTSYVVHYSSSMGVAGEALSAHIAMLCAPTLAPVLKTWLLRMNLDNEVLRTQINLSRTGAALKYRLDITTCQNDKLIYIAPPILGNGVRDSFKGERIQVVKKRYAKLNYAFATEIDTRKVQREHQKVLNALRKAEGLAARRTDAYTTIGTVEVLKNVNTQAEVTDIKRERGFTYLNLNGGDSWAYFHPDDNPEILFNFKGEPNYLIRELLPQYYESAKGLARNTGGVGEGSTLGPAGTRSEVASGVRAASEEEADQPEAAECVEDDTITLVGINGQTSGYFGLRYTPGGAFDFQDIGAIIQLKHFCREYGVPVPDPLRRWRIGYDFVDSSYKLDLDEQRINLYSPPAHMHAKSYGSVPRTIKKIITHVTGGERETYELFLNWLACVVQHRVAIGTAWLLSGTQGTGKGVLFNNIMLPILGQPYVSRATLPAFEKEFNGFIERALLVYVDEIRLAELTKASTALSNLKQLITEPFLSIRRMHTDAYMAPNHANFIFASNHHDSIYVDTGDRRFLVAPRQERPLREVMDLEDINRIPNELERFAGYLLARDANLQKAREMYFSSERERLQHLTQDSSEEVVNALRQGNFKFFLENAPEREVHGKVSMDLHIEHPPTYAEFLDHAYEGIGGKVNLPRDMLAVVFYHVCGTTFRTPYKFTKFLGKRGLVVKQIRVGDERLRGIHGIEFIANEATLREWKQWKLRKQSKTSGAALKVVK